MKQETLEEASIDWFMKKGFNIYNHYDTRSAFVDGAKWQQEQMYSESEVIEILGSYSDWSINGDCTYHKWFEQFKKK